MRLPNPVAYLMDFLHDDSVDFMISPDSNKLRRLKLDNGLDVLLIQNDAFENSEMMLKIDAGFLYDPNETPGLAHLVEHLIMNGNEKYNLNSQSFVFHNMNGGGFYADTSLERMNICSKISHENLKESSDFLLNSITKPLFREKDCQREIELIEHEWRMKNSNGFFNVFNLFDFLTDEKFPESRFNCGNRKTLQKPEIKNEVEKFYSKYFKANRMQLVIKSKLSLDDQEEIAQTFDCISTDLKNTDNPSVEKKMKKEYDGIESLLKNSIDIKFKEEYRGKIIEYKAPESDFNAYIFFMLPSHLDGCTSIHIQCLIECIRHQLKPILFTNKLAKDILATQHNCNRKNILIITLYLFDEKFELINSTVAMIYEYLNQLQPNETLFNTVKKQLIAKCQDYMYESNVIEAYSDCLFLYSNHELGAFESTVQYSEKIFKDIFRRLSDINNWMVIFSNRNSNLPNRFPNSFCTFGNPLPIKLKSAAQEFFKRISLKDVSLVVLNGNKTIEVDEISSEMDSETSSKIKTVHSKLEFGEYTIINDPLLFDQSCKILLTFSSPFHEQKKILDNCFNFALLNRIKKLYEEKGLDISIKIEPIHLFDNNLCFEIKRDELPDFLKTLTDLLNHFELNSSEAAQAKKDLTENMKSYNRSLKEFYFLGYCLDKLPDLIKQYDYEFQPNNKIPISVQFKKKYYLMITAVGDITEPEVKEIYEKLKSTNSRKEYITLNHLKNKVIEKKDLHSPDQVLVMSYPIIADTKLKEFAIANLLEVIFAGYSEQVLRYNNSFSYYSKVELTYVRQQAFLTFFLRTLKDATFIEIVIKHMLASYSKIIDEINKKNDLDTFKKTAYQKVRWETKSKDSIFYFAHLSAIIGISTDNFQKSVKETIYSITIEELKSFQNIFTVEPIVFRGLNK